MQSGLSAVSCSRIHRSFGLLVVLMVPAFFGCIARNEQVGSIRFSASWLTIVGWTAAGIGLFVAAWFTAKRPKNRSWLYALGGAAIFAVAIPAELTHYSLLDDKHFEGRTGFWLAPKTYRIVFADGSTLRLISRDPQVRGNTVVTYHFEMRLKKGGHHSITLDRLAQAVVPEVKLRARAAGVEILPDQHYDRNNVLQ